MQYFLVTFRSVTFAQRGQQLLKRAGIEAVLRRTPKGLQTRGCGYCLQLKGRDAITAAQLLRQEGAEFGKFYAVLADGTMEERAV